MKTATPDFGRNVHCLLGLPIDAVTLAQATEAVYNAALGRQRCFLSTPNLNFLVQSQSAPAFRESVVNSDLSTADGMPIVWFSGLMGIPIPERVAGADIFECLLHSKKRPAVKVYILGGPPGVADQARAKINSADNGLVCVGSGNPGFGSIQDMSQPAQIDPINQSHADFLLVALGAAKGQEWIQHNLAALNVPVVSHLGAVVNFAAGTVKRAPAFAQHGGIEWLWRIKEEPALWRRYWRDGWGMMGLLFSNVLPGMVYRKCMGRKAPLHCALRKSPQQDGTDLLTLSGSAILENMQELRTLFAQIADASQNLTIDMQDVVQIDSAFLGLVLLLERAVARRGGNITAINSCWAVAGYARAQCLKWF